MTKTIKVIQLFLVTSLLMLVSATFAAQPKENAKADRQTEIQLQLVMLQSSLAERLSQQSQLQKALLKEADPTQAAELNDQLNTLNKEISDLRKTFEHLAIGGVDLSTFEEQPQEFDWQKDVILITQPLLDMLKSLTEKPRKIEQLNNVIEQNKAQKAIIEKALAALEANLAKEQPKDVRTSLQEIQTRWQQRLSENQRETELAEIQLATLRGQDISWFETASKSIQDFFSGRGLTLAIAVIASLIAWQFTRLLLWLIKRSQQVKRESSLRTIPYRVASYGFSLLTTLLIISTVIIVFYIRGDILMLALSLLVLAAIVLSMRNFLPRYVAEARLMLNMGAVREGERIVYNGLPWEVCTINIFSILRNPELEGILRLPISSLRDMSSRPSKGESWFPTRKGDFVLLPDSVLAEVVRQTPETVHLLTKGGMHHDLPASDFFNMGVLNLSRGKSFMVTTVFGIDYEHQAIALSQVPKAFRRALHDTLRREGLDEHLNEVVVDLKAAGASSLDYLILLNVKSSAAPLYFKLERLLQQACIQVCNQHGWGIPFPQVTVHQARPTDIPLLPQTAIQ